MKVILAGHAGFCMGVRRAVDKTLDVARGQPGPVYTLGPLIHNPQVVDMLAARGVSPAKGIPESGTVVIRSHGITPELRRELEERGLSIFDATCPRVSRVHGITRSHHQRGFMLVVLGDAGHAEVDGILGYADGQAHVIQGPSEVAGLPDADRVCFVSQTTQDRDTYLATAEALRRRYSRLGPDELVIADTICDSTKNRQEEARILAGKVDAVVVVGGKGSANTQRLAQVAREAGVPAFAVETGDEIDPATFADFKVVGLTAGASTPNWVIRRVHDRLRAISPQNGFSRLVAGMGRWLVLSNVYTALSAAGLALAASTLQGRRAPMAELVSVSLFVFAIHTMIMLSDRRALALNVPLRAASFNRYRKAWLLASTAAAALSVGFGFWRGWRPGLLLLALALASFTYPARLLVRERRRMPTRPISEIPASKDFYMAIGWSVLIVGWPLAAMESGPLNPPAAIAALIMVFGLIFVRAMLRDFRDIQADRLIGRETLPIVLGAVRTRRLIYAILFVLAAPALVLTALGRLPSPMGYLLIFPLVYAGMCVPLFTRRAVFQGFLAEAIIDGAFFVAGGVAMVHWLKWA